MPRSFNTEIPSIIKEYFGEASCDINVRHDGHYYDIFLGKVSVTISDRIANITMIKMLPMIEGRLVAMAQRRKDYVA